MAEVELQCPAILDDGDQCKYKTQKLQFDNAVQLLRLHKEIQHPERGDGHAISGGACRPEKMTRPKADLEMSETTWRDFTGQWERYKRSTKLGGQDLLDQLVLCCSDTLRLDLKSEKGEVLDTLSEAQLMSAMKKMAVRESNPMVHRNHVRSLKQGENEPIRNYVARLREAVMDCQFSVKCQAEMCDADVSYKEEMIRDQCVYGLQSNDTQAKILALGSKLLPLEDVVNKAEAEEQARLTQTKIAKPEAAPANANVAGVGVESKLAVDTQTRCKFCSQPGHGGNPEYKVRKAQCPAWGKNCLKCEGKNHFRSACKQKSSKEDSKVGTNSIRVDDSSSAQFSAMTSQVRGVEKNKEDKNWKLSHVEWDKELEHWREIKPKNMPKLNVNIRMLTQEHSVVHPNCYLLRPGWSDQKPGKIQNFVSHPDTGAQVTVAGLGLLQKLNLSRSALIPVSQSVSVANEAALQILGGLIIEVSVKRGEETLITKQLCYISKLVRGLFLSLAACKDLTLVHKLFPEPMGTAQANVNNIRVEKKSSTNISGDGGASSDSGTAPCGCPVRSLPPPLPSAMPFPGSEEGKLKEWILARYAASAFNCCTHQPLNKMSGPPLHFDVDQTVKPVARHVPGSVPLHWHQQVKEGLEADCRMGVLEKVPPNTPVEWLHRMVLTPKKDGSHRRTVDLSPLNKACKRHTHHTRSPYHLATSIPKNVKKTTMDAWNGFHSVPLDEESKPYTSFITPWGVFRYGMCPMGWLASTDAYSHRYDNIVKDFDEHVKCVDDVALWDETVEGNFWKTCRYLELCSTNGITFNPKKFHFAQDTVEYLGFEVTNDSVRPSPAMLDSVRKFPTPTNITGVRSFFGLINQVSYSFSMTETMAPFRALLKQSSRFYWDERLQDLFEKAKEEIVRKIEEGVKMFDVNRTTCLATDWSRSGVGFFMLQKYCECTELKPTCCKEGWQLVLAGSRFLRANEENWDPVEGEALAVVYALQKTKYFVLGCKQLIIATDHRPLLGIFNDRDLESVENPRLRKLKEKSLVFRFSMTHVPGRKHPGPDAMSRNPVHTDGLLEGMDTKVARQSLLAGLRTPAEDDEEEETEDPVKLQAEVGLSSYVCPFVANLGVSVQAVTWERVQYYAALDPSMRELIKLVEDGFPVNRDGVSDSVREYFKHRDSLSVCEGVVLYNWRVVVPRCLRREVLEGLHAGHQGVVQMKARAANSVFWPGIDAALQDVRDRCSTCNRIAPSQADEPAYTAPPPVYPFQQVCSDYFELDGATYVVMVDRYSGWPSVQYYARGAANSKALIDTLREWFTIFGVPEECASDGGSTYISEETQKFFKTWGVKHRKSSAYFPHSNTRAEIGVKSMKRLLRDNTGPKGTLNTDKFARAVMQYRNTPLQGVGLSPAQILFGRELRDTLPFAPGKSGIREEWRITADDRERALAKRHSLNLEKLNEHSKQLKPLQMGQTVLCQNQSGNYPKRWDRTATVIEAGPGPRQYLVRMDGSRRLSLRNRKFLRQCRAVADIPSVALDDDVTPTAGTPAQQAVPDIQQTQVVDVPGPNPREVPERERQVVQETPAVQLDTPVQPVGAQQEARGAQGGEGERRYPRRDRRQNVRLKDYQVEMDI